MRKIYYFALVALVGIALSSCSFLGGDNTPSFQLSDLQGLWQENNTEHFVRFTTEQSDEAGYLYGREWDETQDITEDMPGWLVSNNGILTIALDIELTDALIEEGIARELVNRIQNLRKSSGLEITDRILVELEDRPEIHNAVLHCGEYIASQVLATSLNLATEVQGDTLEMDGYNVNINLKKA